MGSQQQRVHPSHTYTTEKTHMSQFEVKSSKDGRSKSLLIRIINFIINFLLSIRLLLVLVLIAVVLIVLIITWFIGYNTGNNAVLSMNTKLKDSYVSNLASYLISRFKPGVDMVEMFKTQFLIHQYNITGTEDMSRALQAMYIKFQGYNPRSLMAAVGDDTGYNALSIQNIYNFGQGDRPCAMKVKKGSMAIHIVNETTGLIDPVLFEVPGINNADSPYWKLMNRTDRKTSWTDIGYNQFDPDFYISYVTPFYMNGRFAYSWSSLVFGKSLNLFMQSTPFSKNAVTMLIDREGFIVGSSSPEDPSFIIKDGIPMRVTPLNGNTTFVREGYQALINRYDLKSIKDGVSISVGWNGYGVNIEAIPFTYSEGIEGMDWLMLLFLPQQDILGDIWNEFRNGLLISLGIMTFGAIVVFLFSLFITFPLSSLSKDIKRIAKLQLSDKKQRKSFLTEVKEIQNAVDGMKFGLRSFNKYVPSSLVRSLLESKAEACLGVSERDVTLLFSDIENFTTICESMNPVVLVENLSEYLERATYHIISSGGTVDKFIGDAIMAFWNAPLSVEDHAYVACKAALNMQKELNDLFDRWSKKGLPDFKTRVGIHSGSSLIGNVGTHERLNYTALGDNVNIASRIEGINKNYGTYISVSGETYERVGNRLFCVPMDLVIVKGKTKALVVYELVCDLLSVTESEKEISILYNQAIDAFTCKNYELCQEVITRIEQQDQRAHRIQAMKEKCESKL